MRLKFKIAFLFSCFIFGSCVPESKKILTEVDIQTTDPVFRTIVAHESEGQLDSLLPFLSHEDPTYRYLAVRAFSSFQEEKALDSLYVLLDDPVIKVRAMTAHSIGQIKSKESEQALIQGFRQRDTMSIDNAANSQILEAMGKLGSKEMASFISSAKGYRDSDTILIEGQLKSLYHFVLRNIKSPDITSFVVNTIRNKNYTSNTRLYAAHCLARPNDLDIENFKFQIAEAFVNEDNVDIKMALATTLKHTSDKEIQSVLLDQLDLDQDYRVKCNIIRTLRNYEYISTIEKILPLFESENQHLALSACEYLKDKGIKEDVVVYRQIARKKLPPMVKAKMYESIMGILPYFYSKTKNATRWQIKQLLDAEEDVYVINTYLAALGNDPESYNVIIDYLDEKTNPVILTAATDALGKILEHKDFDLIYKNYSRFHRRKILEFLKTQMLTGDEGIIGATAQIISNERSGLKPLIDSLDFLMEAKEKLKVPGQIESVHMIENALAFLRGVNTPILTKSESLKSPDWTILGDYEEDIKALVKTEKGVIEIDLYIDRAPGAVLNYIDLATSNYFDNKVFHRVVPNFVIQTGSPRGDNYGGKDYVIASSVAEAYYEDEGYVGMASAGLHTESTQWFVTHSPTPHLDGKYTIFGKVSSGMDVVHDIQVGDRILDVIITGIK
ncbi:MAG: peptidylprolyl isomerase [Bacteroidia bacterium]|nr:peptidylprolyl isomerase [Bacteroidia bacterium]